MPKKQANKRNAGEPETGEADGNVDKIRDILFGTQMRDYEQRLEATEKRLVQNIERATRDLERRIERLDTFARREVDKLTEQIKAERKDRVAENKKIATDLNKFGEQVEIWFAEVEEQLSTEAKDLRNALHRQGEDLAAQLAEVNEQLQTSMNKEVAELTDKKLAREDMAALLTEVSMRLNKDFKLPKG